jgi:hypothetical protein
MANEVQASRTTGRKTRQESRSAEFRQRLLIWKQTPEARRLSLRALARQMGTSHQLLGHYLIGLEKWRYKELCRKAKAQSDAICPRAVAENRDFTPLEEQQIRTCDRTIVQSLVAPYLLALFDLIKREAKCGPLHRCQFETLEMFARRNYPGAQELLQRCLQVGLKKKKRFAEIVKDTSRLEDEPYGSWVRRIWDECEKYDTNCPTKITIELLEKYSRGALRPKERNNLPVPAEGVAKSFRCE